jgi:hypothetical protein
VSAETLSLSRAEWGANPLNVSAGAVLEPERWVGLVMHHDVIAYAPTANVEDVIEHAHAVQRARPDLYVDALGRPEWPYSFGIGEHPNPELAWIVEGRGFARTGAHTENLNSTRYGIVLFGNYSERPMTPGMERAFRELGAWLLAPAVAAGRELAATIGHRQVVPTACPGLTAFASIPRLQPPFTKPLTPATGAPSMEPNTPVQLRKIRDELSADLAWDLQAFTVGAAIEWTHGHAQRADILAGRAAGWAHTAVQSVEALRAELRASDGGAGGPIAVEALSLALRAVLTPELLAAALVELVKRLP